MTHTPAEPLADGEMIEKVAEAIWRAEWTGGEPPYSSWAAMRVENYNMAETFLAQARAAIAAYNPNDRLIATLFDAIQHGDEAHRAWLKEAIDKHFAGEAVPAPKGKGNSDRLREALEALVNKLDECEAPFRNIMSVYYAHGHVYNGPSYFNEREQARAALSHKD